MSNLEIICFNDASGTSAMRAAPSRIQKEHLIDMQDVMAVTKNKKDKAKVIQTSLPRDKEEED